MESQKYLAYLLLIKKNINEWLHLRIFIAYVPGHDISKLCQMDKHKKG